MARGQRGNLKQINDLFENMDTWRHLPAYQLERRADIFFSLYLSDLLSNKFGVQVESVIPEFPIRIGTIQAKSDTNQSFKVDYLVKAKTANKVILVELKTDDTSRRQKQDWYLEQAAQVGLVKLLEGVREIYAATSSKRKYRHLLRALQDMGLIIIEDRNVFQVVQADYDLGIAYIQPNNPEGKDNVISFREAAQIIQQQGDALSIRFSESLVKWATVKAGDE